MRTQNPTIRAGKPEELEFLREIERLAGAAFANHGMAEIAEDDPPSVESLAEYCRDERLWVAVDEQDGPIGYIIADTVDGFAHIEQVSVHPDHAGKRIGQALIDTVDKWAGERNLSALTLTTFRDIPWNAPYYGRLGFEPLVDATLSPGLKAVREQEKLHGLDRWPRVCMKRNIG